MWREEPSSGDLRLPPAQKAPKMPRAELRRGILNVAFWILLTGFGIHQGQSLATQGLRQAQTVFALTFAATALAAAIVPAVRLVRAYRALETHLVPEGPQIARAVAPLPLTKPPP